MSSPRWSRPRLSVTRPRRTFSGIYRTAEDEKAGEVIGGLPLHTASDAVVAAVKLGYRVADTQLERTRRVGRGLMDAAERAGMNDLADPLDASERLLLRAVQYGLEWVEGAAIEPGGPLRRLLRAEYETLGNLMGLREPSPPAKRDQPAPATEGGPPTEARKRDAEIRPRAQATTPTVPRLAVRHEKDSAMRLVRVLAIELAASPGAGPIDLRFHHVLERSAPRLSATLARRGEAPELLIRTQPDHPGGRWCATICDAEGLQIGHVEIEL
jgi:hypothetical protein